MMKPLFSYAGGKSRYLKHLGRYFVKTNTYVEPFVGAGSAFCYMNYYSLASKFVINDINHHFMKLYADIKSNHEDVLREALAISNEYRSIDEREVPYFISDQRDLYNANPTSGRCLFFANRAFGAILGVDQQGRLEGAFGYHLDRRSKGKIISVKDVEEWAKALQNTEILSGPYAKVRVPGNSIVFCDPPYRGVTVNYKTKFDDADYTALFNWCSELANDPTISVIMTNYSDGLFFEGLCRDDGRVLVEYYDSCFTNGPKKLRGKEILMVWNSLGPTQRQGKLTVTRDSASTHRPLESKAE